MPRPVGFLGHVRAPNKDHTIAVKFALHGFRLRALLATPPPASWDSRTLNIIGPIKNQEQCGSCWNFSGTFVVETALKLAGILTVNQALSEQYNLDCGKNGGCNGDDNTTILAEAKATGIPLTSDYGPYAASSGTCKWKQGMQLYKIPDWLFCDSNGGNGVTPTQDIKSSIMMYGAVGCAVDASFQDPGTGIITGTGHNIDHDVALVGWNDTAAKTTATVGSKGNALPPSVIASAGYFIMRNSWDVDWGDKGYAKIAYGAYDIGTEAVAGIPPSGGGLIWTS